MKSLTIRILIFTMLFIPTFITMYLLLKFYPHTGLGRIISLPATILLNIVIILIGIRISMNRARSSTVFIWILIILITISVAIILYPQDYGPHVIQKIWKDVSD